MPVQLNHTIVYAHDRDASAQFLAEMLGLSAVREFGPFKIVETANQVSILVMHDDEEIAPQHYAFLVTEPEFDEIFGRVRERGLAYWADPDQTRQGEINHRDGGRGVYFEDPNGHLLELLTRPYGSGAWPGT